MAQTRRPTLLSASRHEGIFTGFPFIKIRGAGLTPRLHNLILVESAQQYLPTKDRTNAAKQWNDA